MKDKDKHCGIQNGPYLSKGLKAALSGFETHRRRPKQGYQWPQKRTCVHQFFFKKIRVVPIRRNTLVLFSCF